MKCEGKGRRRLWPRRRAPPGGRLRPLPWPDKDAQRTRSDPNASGAPATRKGITAGLWASSAVPEGDIGIDLRVEGAKNKKTYLFEHEHAATVIQAWARGEDARELVWGSAGIWECAAALHIQRVYRGRRGYRHAKRVRIDRDNRAACRLQCQWRMAKARRVYHKLYEARRNLAATHIQRVQRGCWGRELARTLRADLERRSALRMQGRIRCFLACLETARRRRKEAERKEKHRVWRTLAAQVPIGFRSRVNKISDRELQEDWKLYATTLRDCILLFAYKDDLEDLLQVFDRLIRANPRCRVAYQAKAVALLVWGGLPRHKHQHAFYYAEQAVDLIAKADATDLVGMPNSCEAAWDIPDLTEFFFICARERRNEYRGFRAQMNFAVALGCFPGEDPPQRALFYFARALEALKANARFRGELLAHHEAWIRKLELGHRQFWGPRPIEVEWKRRTPLDKYTLWRRGTALVVQRPRTRPLIAPGSQIRAIAQRASKTNVLGSEAGNPAQEDHDDHDNARALEELDTWTCLNFVKMVRVVTVRALSEPRLIVPALERQRNVEIRNAAKERAAVHLQRIVRGAFGRARWRHEFMKRCVLEEQGESLVLKRLGLLRERQMRARAVSRIQAIARGRIVRNEISCKREACVEIQRIVRGRLGRLRCIELERRQRMGVLVSEVYRGVVTIPVVSRGQKGSERGSTQVLLQVLRAGFNYLVCGTDLCTSEQYQSTLTEQHMQRLLDQQNRNVVKMHQIRPTQYDRVVQVLLPALRLSPPIKALGDLLLREGSLTFILEGVSL